MALYSIIRLAVLLVFLWTLLPFFYIFKFIMMLYRYFSSENVKGKVVLITGASSGIGEQLTYEYAKRGACLVIIARRENQLNKVAEEARKLGSPDVVPICADVIKVDDCKRFVEEAVNHFGRYSWLMNTMIYNLWYNNVWNSRKGLINFLPVDHLHNNAGIGSMCPIQDATDITKLVQVMDVNFWGSVYPTYFAIPHLKKSKGTIFVNASASAILHPPGLSIYGASKAALVSFYESMRVELAPEISITIATLGFVDSEMTRGKHLNNEGNTEMNSELSNAINNKLPVMSSSACAKAIVDAVCRKERYVTEPKFYMILFLLETLCPELVEWASRIHYRQTRAQKAKATPPTPQPWQNKSD